MQMVHDSVSMLWPGTAQVPIGGCRDRALLESAVNRPFQSAFGEDAYPEVIGKAAALFHSLVANHCFMDGNKRTAVISLQNFLVLNGTFTFLSDEQMYELALETASHRVRGVSPAQAYDHLFRKFSEQTVSFSKLRLMGLEKPGIRNLYQLSVALRRRIKAVLKWHAHMKKSGLDPLEVRQLHAHLYEPEK